MRSFLIAIVALGICSCAFRSGPYIDLRYPVYIVAEQSFWSGCEEDLASEDACRQSRIAQVRSGINQWFDPFEETDRPQAVILDSKDKLPWRSVNEAIYLKIEKGNCGKDARGKKKAGACYGRDNFFSPLYIVFESSIQIRPQVVAHEFGHALGRDDNDVPEGTGSVMSYDTPTNVLLMDIKMMCRLHRECGMAKWSFRKL